MLLQYKKEMVIVPYCFFTEIVKKIVWMGRKMGGKEEEDQRKTSG